MNNSTKQKHLQPSRFKQTRTAIGVAYGLAAPSSHPQEIAKSFRSAKQRLQLFLIIFQHPTSFNFCAFPSVGRRPHDISVQRLRPPLSLSLGLHGPFVGRMANEKPWRYIVLMFFSCFFIYNDIPSKVGFIYLLPLFIE